MNGTEIDAALSEIKKIQAALDQPSGPTGIKIGGNSSNIFIGENTFIGMGKAIDVDDGAEGIVIWRNKISAGVKEEAIAKLDELQNILERMKHGSGATDNLRNIVGWLEKNADPIFKALIGADSVRKLIQGH